MTVITVVVAGVTIATEDNITVVNCVTVATVVTRVVMIRTGVAVAAVVARVVMIGTGVAVAAVVTRVIVTGTGVAVVITLAVVELEMPVVTGAAVVMLVAVDSMLAASPGTVLTGVIGWVTTCSSKAGGGCDTVLSNSLCENPGIMSASS